MYGESRRPLASSTRTRTSCTQLPAPSASTPSRGQNAPGTEGLRPYTLTLTLDAHKQPRTHTDQSWSTRRRSAAATLTEYDRHGRNRTRAAAHAAAHACSRKRRAATTTQSRSTLAHHQHTHTTIAPSRPSLGRGPRSNVLTHSTTHRHAHSAAFLHAATSASGRRTGTGGGCLYACSRRPI